MNEAGRQIAAAMDAIVHEGEEDRWREQYRTSMKVLRTIPSGTAIEDLTSEQHTAWDQHDEAVRWLQAHAEDKA